MSSKQFRADFCWLMNLTSWPFDVILQYFAEEFFSSKRQLLYFSKAIFFFTYGVGTPYRENIYTNSTYNIILFSKIFVLHTYLKLAHFVVIFIEERINLRSYRTWCAYLLWFWFKFEKTYISANISYLWIYKIYYMHFTYLIHFFVLGNIMDHFYPNYWNQNVLCAASAFAAVFVLSAKKSRREMNLKKEKRFFFFFHKYFCVLHYEYFI